MNTSSYHKQEQLIKTNALKRLYTILQFWLPNLVFVIIMVIIPLDYFFIKATDDV